MKPRFAIEIAAFVLLAVFTQPLHASDSEDPISVRSEVDRAFLTVGDRVNYRLSVRHPAAVKIVALDTSETLRDFEIKEEKSFEDADGINAVSGKAASMTNFTLGEYVLAPAKIKYLDARGNPKEILSNKLYLSVESIDKNQKASSDIADIKGVVGFRSGRWIWISFLLSLGLVSIGALIWYRHRQNLAALNQIAGHSLLSPDEEAYQALHQLFDSDILRRGQYKLYYSRISEIVRRYLERRYQFLALESTTAELMEELPALDVDSSIRTSIRQLLESCDLVKFAKHVPQPADIIQDNRSAKEIIDKTKLIELPPQTPGEPPPSDATHVKTARPIP